MTHYFLGIDIGGTKSHALVAGNDGRVVGFGECGAGSYEIVGWEGLREALRLVTERAFASAGITKDQVAGVGYGIAGYDWPSELPGHVEAIGSLEIGAPYALVNDTIIGLMAGAADGWGIGVVSGTGSNCWGRDRDGREAHTSGGGEMFAEYAGGGDLVRRAVQMVGKAWSWRGPQTQLCDAFVARSGAQDLDDLLEGLYLGTYTLSSDDAPLVFQVADAGDAVALELVRWAGRELGSLAIGVIRQLAVADVAFDVVQIGSLYKGSPLMTEVMGETVRAVAPQARLVRLSVPPVVGAVMLGMEQAGVDFRPLRETLITTASSGL